MSNPEPATSVIARILATGYNRHVRDHGPDADHAGEATETADGHGFIVSRGGAPYAVRVERAQAMAEPGPLTPGQCWAALREHIRQERAAQDEIAADHSELSGHDRQEERCYGRVEALDELLATMTRMEAGQ